MLHVQLPTTTSTNTYRFDGTTPTFLEWARELRAYLNISQIEHIDLVDFAYEADQPLTTDIMVQQTPPGHRQHEEIARLTQALQDFWTERAQPTATAMPTSIRSTTNSTHNKYFRMLLQQECLEQVNSLVTSSRMPPSLTANQTIYYVNYNGQTSDGRCTDSSDINMLQELVYNSTPCYRASCTHNLIGYRHCNNDSLKNRYKTSLPTR